LPNQCSKRRFSVATKGTAPLGDRLYFWDHYAAVARAVRYETLTREDLEPYLRHLEERYGASNVREAVQEVCHTNWHTKPETVQLRPEVRKLCFGLLGPPRSRRTSSTATPTVLR
jgi:hypothetical protein